MKSFILAAILSIISAPSFASGTISDGNGPSFCDSIVQSIPADPHERVHATRVLLDHKIHRAVVSFHTARAYMLEAPSDIFQSHFITESRYYSLSYNPSDSVIYLHGDERVIAGSLMRARNGKYTFTISDDLIEEVVCK